MIKQPTVAKINLVRNLFRGRQDAHGEGQGLCKKEKITDEIILSHLKGNKRIGIYPLSPQVQDGAGCYFACADIDTHDLNIAQVIANDLQHIEIPAYIEVSKSKGYHVWVFFSEPVDAKLARGMMKYAIDGADVEIFPKQTKITTGYGNYINLPLFGTDVLKGKTAFLNGKNQLAEDQWEFLQSIKKITPDEISEICEINEITADRDNEIPVRNNTHQSEKTNGNLSEYNSCEFFEYCQQNAEKLPEPLWYAMLSNLARFENGRTLAHQFSQDYPSYSKEKTDKKFDHAKKASGPITCKSIGSRGFECSSIKRCKAKAPAGLFVKIHNSTNFVKSNNNLEPTEDEKDLGYSTDTDLPSLPDECWRSGFYHYREALKNSTEACDEYHFSLYLAAAGLILGRHSAIYYIRKRYPNLYICNVGDTGKSRKSSAAEFIIDMLNEIDDDCLILRHLATPEGLLSAMQDETQKNEDEIAVGRRTLAFHTELASMMKKAQQKTSSGLIERLTSLYDCPPIAENPTISNPLQVARPFLSMIGLSTGAWLEDSLTEREIRGGFANRFLYFIGKTKKPMAYPPPPQEASWEQAKLSLLALRESTYSDGLVLSLDEQARDLWKNYYENDWALREYENETITSLIQRIPSQIMKVALVYARMEGMKKIDWKILDAAIKVGEFCTKSIQSIFRLYGANEYTITEAKVIDALKKLGGEASCSQLYRGVTGRISAHILQKNYESLAAVGRIRLWDQTYADSIGRTRSRKMVSLIK